MGQSNGDTAHDNVYLHWQVDIEAQEYKYPLWNQFEMNESAKMMITMIVFGIVARS
ncbi:MAG: hypothetical protein AAGA77_24995 [Bacteroidota bacterium]